MTDRLVVREPVGIVAPQFADKSFIAWLVVSTGVGAALRLYEIREQILLDDEWHAIRSLVWYGYGHIMKHFGVFDHCIPLTLYDRLVMDTVGLSEMGMRFPVLASGIVALVVLPLLVRRLVGSATAIVFAALLAISPAHIYFSRYARPYAITLLLSFIAVVAFYLWWREGRRSWAATYCFAAAAAVYFHLLALPTVLAPLPWAVLDSLQARKGRGVAKPALRLAAIAGCLAALLVALLGPPLFTDGRAIIKKVGRGEALDLESLRGAAEIIFGTGNQPVLFALVVLTIVGLVVLRRRAPGLLGFLIALILAQTVSFRIAAPLLGEKPFVIARYHLWILPILLLFLSLGMVAVEKVIRSRMAAWPRGGLGWLSAIALVAAGPLPEIYRTPNGWTNHGVYQYAYRPNSHVRFDNLEPVRLSSFYRELRSREPGTIVVLEAPWNFKWYLNPYPFFQRFHRQHMKVGLVARETSKYLGYGELLPELKGLDLQNAVHVSDLGKLRALGVDYVVFHRDLGSELRLSPAATYPDVTPWIARYRVMIGVPVYEDGDIVVYRLK